MKHFRRIYIYKDTKMPECGWLQGCFICYQITGRLIVYNTVERGNIITEYDVFVCPLCKKNIQEKESLKIEYNNKCQEYIDINGL